MLLRRFVDRFVEAVLEILEELIEPNLEVSGWTSTAYILTWEKIWSRLVPCETLK